MEKTSTVNVDNITPINNPIIYSSFAVVKKLEDIETKIQSLPEKIAKLILDMQKQNQKDYTEKIANSLEDIAHSSL